MASYTVFSLFSLYFIYYSVFVYSVSYFMFILLYFVYFLLLCQYVSDLTRLVIFVFKGLQKRGIPLFRSSQFCSILRNDELRRHIACGCSPLLSSMLSLPPWCLILRTNFDLISFIILSCNDWTKVMLTFYRLFLLYSKYFEYLEISNKLDLDVNTE